MICRAKNFTFKSTSLDYLISIWNTRCVFLSPMFTCSFQDLKFICIIIYFLRSFSVSSLLLFSFNICRREGVDYVSHQTTTITKNNLSIRLDIAFLLAEYCSLSFSVRVFVCVWVLSLITFEPFTLK